MLRCKQAANARVYLLPDISIHFLGSFQVSSAVVHAKKLGLFLERSLLFFLLMVLWGPSTIKAQRNNLQPPQHSQVKFSSAFLNGRLFTQHVSGQQSKQDDGLFSATLQKPAAPLYDVVALRVSFQADTSRFTTGDGTFAGALFDTLESKVDPLPHDAAYFEAHLQFLENYVGQVSDGKTQIRTHLIPEVVKVSQEMGAYSPTGLDASSDREITKLAKLVEEAWMLASERSAFDMSAFDPETTAFILFHAGVGRDIELVGTSLDKTPLDLPTIFFNEIALSRLLPEASITFNGFPVNHTILMPRTESRLGFDFIQDVPFLVEFSINGLLAASFFNYLDVPDLFDTETGQSAIGPFGLMDALGIFAYNGLFPPEPSGWTKSYLGWADPIDLTGEQTVSLMASSAPSMNEQARVAVSASEYFLIENRNRDLDNDGLTLTIYRDGQTFTQVVENGQEDFNSIDIDGFEGGVVVDVDDFDWALPGGVDEDDNDLNGGILVWHIDERVLAGGLSENRVNVDPVRRGVDLEEADGAQDIGFPTDNIFGPQAFLGTPFDFFYEGNPIVVITGTGEELRLYENRFGPDTFPNSNSNADGPSFVELNNFTLPGPVMTFDYVRAASVHTPVEGFPLPENASVPVGSYLTAFPNVDAGLIYQTNRNEIAVSARGANTPSFFRETFVKDPLVLPDGRIAMLAADDIRSLAKVLLVQGGEVTEIPLQSTVHFLPNDENQLMYDPAGNRLIALIQQATNVTTSQIILNDALEVSNLQGGNLSSSAAVTRSGDFFIRSMGEVSCLTCQKTWQYELPEQDKAGQLVVGEDISGQVGAYTYISGERVIFLNADQSVTEIDLQPFEPQDASFELNRFPVLVDLDNDQRLEVLVTYGSKLLAFSSGGGLADGFPIDMPAPATTQPLIGAFAGQSGWTVFVSATDGYVYAFDLTNGGVQAPGFPLAVGADIPATPLLRNGNLYAVDSTGTVSAWQLQDLETVWWGEQGGNSFHTNFVAIDGSSEPPTTSSNLLTPEQNYNWPNPIREGKTHFRLTPTSDVQVTITIIDTAGTLIDKIVIDNVSGNTSTDIAWETDAASGLYYARVEASTGEGTSETKLIKMAIVR